MGNELFRLRCAAGAVAAMLLASLVVAGGCVTRRLSSSDGWPMPPKPRAAPRTPEGAVANRMTLLGAAQICH